MNPYVMLAAVVVLGVSTGLAGYKGYDYGVSKTEAAHAEHDKIVNQKLAELSTANWNLDQQVQAATNQQHEDKVRTIIKYRTKLVSLPDRNCGWSSDERVLLSSSYCTAFPSAPNCLHDQVPPAAVSGGRNDGQRSPAMGK